MQFKVSTTKRFHIDPSVGMLKPNSEAKINVVIHREVNNYGSQIVGKAEEERIQVLYGEKYQESRYFSLLVENGSKSDKLNLTMIVHQKEEEIVMMLLDRKESRRKSAIIAVCQLTHFLHQKKGIVKLLYMR